MRTVSDEAAGRAADLPDPVTEPAARDPGETGEIGSEGGSPGDLLLPPVRPWPERAGADHRPLQLPAALWWALIAPVAVLVLWFATSLAAC